MSLHSLSTFAATAALAAATLLSPPAAAAQPAAPVAQGTVIASGSIGGLAPAVSAGATPAGTALPVPVTGWDITVIGPGYYSFRYTGTRNVFLITPAGVIVTDPIEPAAARILRDEIRKLTDQPVKYVVYSHQHWDHILGAQIFKDEGATIVSHASCLAHFDDRPNPKLVRPDFTFTGERHVLQLGGRTLTLRYLGVNHGDCLVVMTPDGTDVPFIVDLATPGGMPLPMIPDYSLHHWVRTLRELEGWSFKQYVGGHGPVLAHQSRLGERREYIEALMAETEQAMNSGTPPLQIPDVVAERLKARFGHLRGFNNIVRDNVLRTMAYYGMGW
ncbi:MAG: MBL fold metallo-hydrolase [Steroidobacteraceae bacterium]|nr:MBL fold metallo-hydrolase [Nevskiaceae bacterium]MCP5339926.1 MBL fold metallo-hydrolase [Nevskiaceae bacterium]MCP5471015.1 MBL fold metallo-hydrolase [Nevskiaceae bacterium]